MRSVPSASIGSVSTEQRYMPSTTSDPPGLASESRAVAFMTNEHAMTEGAADAVGVDPNMVPRGALEHSLTVEPHPKLGTIEGFQWISACGEIVRVPPAMFRPMVRRALSGRGTGGSILTGGGTAVPDHRAAAACDGAVGGPAGWSGSAEGSGGAATSGECGDAAVEATAQVAGWIPAGFLYARVEATLFVRSMLSSSKMGTYGGGPSDRSRDPRMALRERV